MTNSEELLRKKIEDVRFSLRLYEIYSRKMPSDTQAVLLCEKYKKLLSVLIEEHSEKYGRSEADDE